MKFACHKARALSRVAITIFLGMDEIEALYYIEKIRELLLAPILTCQAPTRTEVLGIASHLLAKKLLYEIACFPERKFRIKIISMKKVGRQG